MLIIANAYRRLNMWNANSGASFEWVGRAINPYLGFLTGWLMIVGFVVGTLSGVVILGPSVLVRLHELGREYLAQRPHRHRGGGGDDGDRGRRHPDHRPGPGRDGGGRVRDPGRDVDLGTVLRARASPRHVPHHQRLVQPQRSRRAGQHRRRVPDRGVRLQRLGRHHLRQRRGQAPARRTRAGPRSSRSPCCRHLHGRPGGVAGRHLAEEPPGERGAAGLGRAGASAAATGPR